VSSLKVEKEPGGNQEPGNFHNYGKAQINLLVLVNCGFTYYVWVHAKMNYVDWVGISNFMLRIVFLEYFLGDEIFEERISLSEKKRHLY
jgi:hypothetical protein